MDPTKAIDLDGDSSNRPAIRRATTSVPEEASSIGAVIGTFFNPFQDGLRVFKPHAGISL